MHIKRYILRWAYPAFIWYRKLLKKDAIISNKGLKPPALSFYILNALSGDGKPLDFITLQGKYVLLVNTASDCGYTAQYRQLQQLQEKYPGTLTVVAFPSNDFRQEKEDDKDITAFCRSQYGVTFPIMQKCRVTKGAEQHAVYQWLTDENLNGWNNRAPGWNFDKYLVNPQGILTHYFSSAVSPLEISIAM